MLKKVLSLYLMFFLTGLNAQQKLDSLYNIWQDENRSDSLRIDSFFDYIVDGFIYSKPDTAQILATQLYDFSEARKNSKGMVNASNLQAYSHYFRSNYAGAISFFTRSLNINKDIKDEGGMAYAMSNIGMVYTDQGKYMLAKENFDKSLKIHVKLGNKRFQAMTLFNLGRNYQFMGIYPKAIVLLNSSSNIFREIEEKVGLANSLNEIGIIYKNEGDYENALAYFEESLEIYNSLEQKGNAALCLGNIANVYARMKHFDKALKYHDLSLKMNENFGNTKMVANAYNNIGLIYFDQDNPNLALEFFTKSLNIKNEIEDDKGVSTTLTNIGNAHNRKGNYGNAITYCQQAYEMAGKLGVLHDQLNACECLYEAYKGSRQGNRALQYHEKMLEFKDSLDSKETAKKLQQMEFAKQVMADSLQQVEKELQVEMAHQTEVRQKDRNRNLAIGAGIFFLVLSGGFYSRWRYVRKSKKIIENEKDRSENLLLNILPSEIAEELKAKGSVDARDFDEVSVLFTDFKGFTTRSEKLSARELVDEINLCFKAFDHICGNYNIEKIKTIGDAYMAGGGLPVPSDDAVKNTVLAALEMQAFMEQRAMEKQAKHEIPFEMRVGIHTGPVVAGIVGVKKFQYDIWGDTVNTASRMESSGEVGKVNISQATYEIIKDDPQFTFETRGKIKAKGKGEVEMYFVSRQNELS